MTTDGTNEVCLGLRLLERPPTYSNVNLNKPENCRACGLDKWSNTLKDTDVG